MLALQLGYVSIDTQCGSAPSLDMIDGSRSQSLPPISPKPARPGRGGEKRLAARHSNVLLKGQVSVRGRGGGVACSAKSFYPNAENASKRKKFTFCNMLEVTHIFRV